MSTPEKQEQKEQAPSRLPFVLHALGFYLPDASTEEDSPSSEADPARPVAAPKDPDWDVSHLCTRSYKFQPLGEEDFASPPSNQDKKSSSEAVPAPKSSPASDSQSEAEEQDLPYLVEVPQLSSVQLNVVFPKFIRTVNFNGITEILIRKKNRKELEEWEYREWKDMINTLKKCPTFKNSDEKTAWKRAFLNDAIMWIVAIDFRYKFDKADDYLNLLDARKLTLLYRGYPFGLLMEESGKEKQDSKKST